MVKRIGLDASAFLLETISQTKQQRTGYVDVFLVQCPFEERFDEGDVCCKRIAEHRVALLRQSNFDAAAVVFHGVPSNEPLRHESIEDAGQGTLGDQGYGPRVRSRSIRPCRPASR